MDAPGRGLWRRGAKKKKSYATITAKGGIIMASEALTSRGLKLRLNNGTDADGKLRTVDISLNSALGGLSVSGWDAAKVVALTSAIEPVISKTVNSIVGTTESRITN